MSETTRTPVGFAAGDWLRWLGGINYYRSLLSAVLDDPERTLDPVLFLGRGHQNVLGDGFPPVRQVHTSIFDRRSPAWFARAAGRRAFSRDPLFERLLDANDIRVVSHLNVAWKTRRRAILGWIPDLQHFRIPENFSGRDRSLRDQQFQRIIELSTFVIVSSEASKHDLIEYSAAAANKARVLHFVPEIPCADSIPTAEELSERHGIEGSYFHLPNQFWAHKNHELVVEALAALASRGRRPLVIATGTTTGSSGTSEHHDSLMARVREMGLETQFRSLGVVPFSEMVGLMTGSLAVINPSRFEGWSTTIEEAKCLGAPVLCSDLPVHREQDPLGARYFAPDDAAGLAEAMAEVLDRGDEGDERAIAVADAVARRLRFAREFTAIIEEADATLDTGRRTSAP